MIATDWFAVAGWLLSLGIFVVIGAVLYSVASAIIKRGKRDGGAS